MSDIKLIDNRFTYGVRHDIFVEAGSALPVRTTASNALSLFPDYEPVISPMYTRINGVEVAGSSKGIYLKNAKGEWKEAGNVKSGYTLITPNTFCKLWDDNLGLPVKAMGSKGSIGEIFYIASDIGTIKKNGLDITCNLMGVSPMNGKGSVLVQITPVNMWCTNQLAAAKKRAVITFNVPHKGDVLGKVAGWMKHLLKQVRIAQEMITDDFITMMNKPYTTEIIDSFLDKVLEIPLEPTVFAPHENPDEVIELWTKDKASVNNKRDAFMELIEGSMRGYDMHKDDMFKAYNAYAELVQYSPAKRQENRSLNCLLGDRGLEIEKGYTAAMHLSLN